MERPELTKDLKSELFKEFYYLKEELVAFCRMNKLLASGSKQELTERIAYFLETGKEKKVIVQKKKSEVLEELTTSTLIEENIICSEKHRAFFKEKIGKSFSFNVAFQKWLKANAGKTYQDAIEAYIQILEEKKKGKMTIDKQFEYNTYIRDFFEDNPSKTLEEAIKCWKYKKSLKGHHRYEKQDIEQCSKEGES